MFKQIITFLQDRRDQIADAGRTIKVAKILRVFAREKELITDVFSSNDEKVCEHPGRCAIGALLVAAGVPDDTLTDRWSVTSGFGELLRAEYGLDKANVDGIMDANDGVYEQYADLGCKTIGVRTEYSKVCAELPVNTARVCEVQAYVRDHLHPVPA